jgi:hypothetical protein
MSVAANQGGKRENIFPVTSLAFWLIIFRNSGDTLLFFQRLEIDIVSPDSGWQGLGIDRRGK